MLEMVVQARVCRVEMLLLLPTLVNISHGGGGSHSRASNSAHGLKGGREGLAWVGANGLLQLLQVGPRVEPLVERPAAGVEAPDLSTAIATQKKARRVSAIHLETKMEMLRKC